jgi:hypothetical protein
MIVELGLFTCLRRGHWVLIILMIKEYKAFYLNSLKNKVRRITQCCHRFSMMLSSNMLTEVEMCQNKVKIVYTLSII